MKKIDLLVVIYTFDRTFDARVNQEIIRNHWGKSGFFGDIKIIHAFNGSSEWYPKKYLEDVVLRRKNLGHFAGAADLIDAGFKEARKRYPKYEYGVVLAADTWILEPKYIAGLIERMSLEGQRWATCPWGQKGNDEYKQVGAATDFFVLDMKWADKYKMLPLCYQEFFDKYAELLYYHGSNISVEKLVFGRFVMATRREQNISSTTGLHRAVGANLLTMEERRPVHPSKSGWERRAYWPKMGLATHHDLEPKQEVLRKYKIAGESIKLLTSAKKLDGLNYDHLAVRHSRVKLK